MASNNINVGNESNDGNGQTLRDGFISVRKNLAEIFGITYTSDTQDLSGVDFSSDVVTEGGTNKYLLTNSVINEKMADDSVGADELIDNSVGALALNVSGNGANGAVLKSDGDGTMSWIDPADTLSEVLSLGNTTGGTDIAVSANDDITFTDSSKAIFGDGDGLSIFHNGTNAEIVNTEGELNLKSYTATISTDNTLALSIDALQDANFFGKVGIGTQFSPTAALDVVSGNAQMTFNGAASDLPSMWFSHNAVPVDGEEIGVVNFTGFNNANQDTQYVQIKAKAEDVTDGTEDGSLTFETMKDGTLTESMTLSNTALIVSGNLTAPSFLGALNGTINTATTGATQLPSVNNTTIATTAFANAAVAASAANYLPLAGGTLTGNLIGTGASFSTVSSGGTISFGSLKDTAEDITITKFVDEADGLANNDNDTTIPTSAAVVDYVTATPGVMNYKAIGLAMDYMSRVHDDGGTVEGMEQVMINTEKLILS